MKRMKYNSPFWIQYLKNVFNILAMSCGQAPVNPNVIATPTSGHFNETVIYTCDPGYTLQGSDENTCEHNTTSGTNHWSNSAPTCERKYYFSSFIGKLTIF